MTSNTLRPKRYFLGRNATTLLWIFGNVFLLLAGIALQDSQRFYWVMSVLGALQLLLALTTSVMCEGGLFTPLIIYQVVMYLFLFGQCLIWLFTEETTARNLIELYDNRLIVKAQIFTLGSMFFFHLGLFAQKRRTLKVAAPNKSAQLRASMFFIGILMLCVTIIPEIVFNVRLFALVQAHGYTGIYETTTGALMNAFLTLREFFFPAVVLVLCGDPKRRKWLRNALTGAILLDVIVGLYAGSRSDAMMQIISLVLILQILKTDGRKSGSGSVIKYALLFATLIIVANIVRVIRVMPNRDLFTFFEYLFNPDTNDSGNMVLDIMGEMGATMGTLLETMTLVPTSYGFLHGKSYLLALTWLLPGFLSNNAWQAASMNNWIDTVRYTGNGWGFSTTAEAYYNFGDYGILFFLLIGWVAGKLFRNLNRDYFVKNPVEFALSFILFNRLLIFSRIDFLSALPSIVYFYLCIKLAIYFVAYLIRTKGGNKCPKEKESP